MTVLDLECFAGAPRDNEAPAPTFEDGFATGFEAGLAEARSESAALSTEIVASLHRISASEEAAEARVIAALRPLFQSIADAVLPELLVDVIGITLADELVRRAESALSAVRVLRVCEQDLAGIRDAVALTGLELPIESDPRLARGQAVLGAEDTETMFDLAEVADAIRMALAALTSPDTGDQDDD